jgi:hypothetical protein
MSIERVDFRGTVDDWLWDVIIRHGLATGCSSHRHADCTIAIHWFLRDPDYLSVPRCE